MPTDYDYTKEDEVFDGEEEAPVKDPSELLEEMELGSLGTVEDAEQIEKTLFKNIEPGEHILKILKFDALNLGEDGTPEPKVFDVYVKGADGRVRPSYYEAHPIRVTFCLPDAENRRVSDYFKIIVPNASLEQHEAYEKGAKDESKAGNPQSAGFEKRKLSHFLSRLGFHKDETGKFGPEAVSLKNWKFHPDGSPRLISAEIEAKAPMPKLNKDTGLPEHDEKGNTVLFTPQPGIKMYSYKQVNSHSSVPESPPAPEPAKPAKPAASKGKKK